MDKNTILNYVMNTPGNTNRAILDGMLEDLMGYDAILIAEDLFSGFADITVEAVKFNFEDIKKKILTDQKVSILLKARFSYGDTYETRSCSTTINYNETSNIISCAFSFLRTPNGEFEELYNYIISIDANGTTSVIFYNEQENQA